MRSVQTYEHEFEQALLLTALSQRFTQKDPSAMQTIHILRTDIAAARRQADSEAIASHYAPTLRNIFRSTMDGFASIGQGFTGILGQETKVPAPEKQQRDGLSLDAANSTNDMRKAISIYMEANPDHGVTLSAEEQDAMKLVHAPILPPHIKPVAV